MVGLAKRLKFYWQFPNLPASFFLHLLFRDVDPEGALGAPRIIIYIAQSLLVRQQAAKGFNDVQSFHVHGK